MDDLHLGKVETKFADLIWENAPITINELIKKSNEELEWKRTTTYTVLNKLCNKGIFKIENRVVNVSVTKEKFYSLQGKAYIEETFNGSLPAFVSAFVSEQKLKPEEINEIIQIIQSNS